MLRLQESAPIAPGRLGLAAQKVELGQALFARAADVTRMTADSSAESGLSELASHRYAKRVRHVQNVATRGIAKLLTSGRGSTEKELHFISKLGVLAALHGLPVATLTWSCLLWRDANLQVLDQEASRLHIAPEVLDEAAFLVRSSADTGIILVARAYDHHMLTIGHREDAVTLALHDSETQLEAAVRAASRKDAALSAALAEITDKNDQMKGVNRQQSDFIANVSHELRTPLAGILGHNELLLDAMKGDAGTEQRQDALEVQVGGQLLLSLLNDILDESQIESGTLALKAGRVDVRAAIEAVVALLRPLAAEKRLYVRAGITHSAFALADEVRLKQILTNLIGNAIKFTDVGGVTVNCLPWSGFWRVSVADTGIGLAEHTRNAVFERFVQLDASITRRFGGLGLGLSIVRGLVDMQGGEVGVDSTLGQGSTFWFTVPAFDESRAQGAPARRRDRS